MGSEGLEDIIRWREAWDKYRGIALDGEDWCDVRHGRLIITPDGTGKKKNIV